MTWWAWVLLWLLLVLAGGAVLFLAARRLFRQGVALTSELGEAGERLSAVTAAIEELQEARAQASAPAVFSDPAVLRAERWSRRRSAGSAGRGRGRPGR